MAPIADKFPTIRNKGLYQIQSVDLETFLERRGTEVVLRPRKKASDNQKWVFVKKKDNVYEIESPATSIKRILIGDATSTPFCLALDERPEQPDPKIGTSWRLYIANPFTDHLFIVNEELRTKRINNYLISLDDEGKPNFKAERDVKADQDYHFFDKGEDYLWRLVEVTPASLPDGDTNGQYRIRTLNGMVIHSLPNLDTLSIKNQNRGDHRAWNIKDLGNGYCTLYNVGKKKYLATKLVSDSWVPYFSDEPPLSLVSTGSNEEEEKDNSPWRIEVLSEFTWSITVIRGTDRFGFKGRDKLSLSLKDDTAILKPWKKAHNQLWMIEPTDAPVTVDHKDNPSSTEILQGAPFTSTTSYKFMDSDKLGGIRVALNRTSKLYEVLYNKDASFTPSPLFMERKPSGQAGEIFIYRLLNAQKYYLTVSGNQVVSGPNPYSWTIEQAQNQVFYLLRDTTSNLYLSPNIQSGALVVKSQSGPNDTTTFWAIVP